MRRLVSQITVNRAGRSASQALALSSGEIFVIGGQVVINSGNTAIVPNVDIISE